MTSQERNAKAKINTYENSRMFDLYDAYGRFSQAKANAWRHCEYLCKEYDGYDLRVIGRNSSIFTAGFKFTDRITGVLKFMYITPNYKTVVDYE